MTKLDLVEVQETLNHVVTDPTQKRIDWAKRALPMLITYANQNDKGMLPSLYAVDAKIDMIEMNGVKS